MNEGRSNMTSDLSEAKEWSVRAAEKFLKSVLFRRTPRHKRLALKKLERLRQVRKRSIKQRDSCDPDCQLSISIGTPKVEMNFAEFEVSHEQNDCNGHSHIFAKRSMKPKGVALDSNTSKSKLDSAVFRMINEKLYTCDSETAAQMLAKDGNAFLVYHSGYQNQMSRWPVKPINVIIDMLKSRSPNLVVADIGCGEGTLALSVPNKVHSFDLCQVNDHVIICDAAKLHTKLPLLSVDVCVFCLSLMGTNFHEFISSANKTLKLHGSLIIAEVTSRFDVFPSKGESTPNTRMFVESMKKFGYNLVFSQHYGYFVLLEFKKKTSENNDRFIKDLNLKPCIYKRR